MSFQIRDLSVLAYANGFTLWHYKTDDHFPTILKPGYFKSAESLMAGGDLITVSSTVNGISVVKNLYVERIINGTAVVQLVDGRSGTAYSNYAEAHRGSGYDVTGGHAELPPRVIQQAASLVPETFNTSLTTPSTLR